TTLGHKLIAESRAGAKLRSFLSASFGGLEEGPLAQDHPIGIEGGAKAVRASLAEAWNASFVGRYVKSHHISRTALVVAALGVADEGGVPGLGQARPHGL